MNDTTPPPGHQPPKQREEIVGVTVDLARARIREASAELLLKREEHGRDATTALIGQVAVVGSFLGAYSLLNDTAKAAVIQSDYAL
jgi:hypothetical protein